MKFTTGQLHNLFLGLSALDADEVKLVPDVRLNIAININKVTPFAAAYERASRRLLADLETTEESVTCPHGRPTRLLVEWQELTRHFRRNY